MFNAAVAAYKPLINSEEERALVDDIAGQFAHYGQDAAFELTKHASNASEQA